MTKYRFNDNEIPYGSSRPSPYFPPNRDPQRPPYDSCPNHPPYHEIKPVSEPIILATEVQTSLMLTFERHFKDHTSDSVTVKEGDRITVQYLDVSKYGHVTITGILKNIISSSYVAKKENLTIIVDASTDGNSMKVSIPLTEVISIVPTKQNVSDDAQQVPPVSEDVPTPSPVEQPISWTLSEIAIEGNLLKIPYARLKPGQVDLTISDRTGDILFKERFIAAEANPDASFTWSLRDFSTVPSLVETDPDHGLLIEDGEYIYRNGDNQKDVISHVDNNNALIIPAGTEIVIEIRYQDNNDNTDDALLTKVYTVTAEDVAAVTSI